VYRVITATLIAFSVFASTPEQRVSLPGLAAPVEILRDRWGVPHIYAGNVTDLFFAQGYMTARDRLWQIDLWRRTGTGKLAEILGPAAIARDRLARLVRYRGNPEEEWRSYGPNTREIVTAFVSGINAYILSLQGRWPAEFQIGGYSPGLWVPEDCLSRVAGLLMTRNLTREVSRVADVKRFGLQRVAQYLPPDPQVPLELPKGLDLADISGEILRAYNEAVGAVRFPAQGSNNWVVDGSMTVTGKPILANDPHRPIQIPSLRKTFHLVAPGWNVFGAGEPALPGVALGHNESIGFGFTIVGIDQQDLYVEKLNPASSNEYFYRGAWRKMEVEKQQLTVKGRTAPAEIELHYTVHGPVIHEDLLRRRAYALRWVGSEPGAAGYLAGLALAQAKNWAEFSKAVARYKVPSENIVYADRSGNIGWHAAGMAPIRNGWSGLFPVPGDTGDYEWSGFRPASDLPHLYNPPQHWIATANHNILPPGYKVPLGYEWALPFRYQRIREVLSRGGKFTVADFERLQQDVTSVPARRFQAAIGNWRPREARLSRAVQEVAKWDGAMTTASIAASIYEVWIGKLPAAVFGRELGARTDLGMLLKTLESKLEPAALERSLSQALTELEKRLGPDIQSWQWGKLHQVVFRHPLNQKQFDRGSKSRPGDGNTVNSSGMGSGGFLQTTGASYRQILDLSDWDNSVMTNVPGESGDPASPHYSDLIDEWAAGKYHPMPFSRKAVQAAAREKILLIPKASTAKAKPATASTK